jgi:hypothetical protein
VNGVEHQSYVGSVESRDRLLGLGVHDAKPSEESE